MFIKSDKYFLYVSEGKIFLSVTDKTEFKIDYIEDKFLLKSDSLEEECLYSIEDYKLYKDNILLFENVYFIDYNKSPAIELIYQGKIKEALDLKESSTYYVDFEGRNILFLYVALNLDINYDTKDFITNDEGMNLIMHMFELDRSNLIRKIELNDKLMKRTDIYGNSILMICATKGHFGLIYYLIYKNLITKEIIEMKNVNGEDVFDYFEHREYNSRKSKRLGNLISELKKMI